MAFAGVHGYDTRRAAIIVDAAGHDGQSRQMWVMKEESMAPVASVRHAAWCSVCAGLAGLILLGGAGCASDQPKPSAQPVTPGQVRGHADKAFESLKQEETRSAPERGGSIY